MARAGGIDWRYTETRRRKFIAKLAETYDVEASLEHAVLTWPQVCELRVRHPGFAARFEEVIAAGYDRIEAMLLKRAGVGGGGGGGGEGDLAIAQALLKQRRSMRADAGAGAAKRAVKPGARSDAIDSIMNEFAMLRAGQRKGQEQGRDANGMGSRGRGSARAAGGGR
jgi:hypothetical protein